MTIPTLTALLTQHRPYGLDCACGRPINSDGDWARHVAQVWREACTVRTDAALAVLPHGTIVRDAKGDAWQRDDENNLSGLYGPWCHAGFEVPCWSDEIPLPVHVVDHPDWSDQ